MGVGSRFPADQELSLFLHDLRNALTSNEQQIRRLADLWIAQMKPCVFLICVQRPQGRETLYRYPVFRAHRRDSEKGRVRSRFVGYELSIKAARRFGQEGWWRRNRSRIRVFNCWLTRLRAERTRLLALLRQINGSPLAGRGLRRGASLKSARSSATARWGLERDWNARLRQGCGGHAYAPLIQA